MSLLRRHVKFEQPIYFYGATASNVTVKHRNILHTRTDCRTLHESKAVREISNKDARDLVRNQAWRPCTVCWLGEATGP